MSEISAPSNVSGNAAQVRNQPAVTKRAEVGAEVLETETASVEFQPKAPQSQSTSSSNSVAGTRLSIAFDEASNRFVYRGVDAETGEIVNQLPPEEALRRFAYNRELASQRSGGDVDTSA